MNKKQKRNKAIVRVMAIILALGMIVLSLSYLFMFMGEASLIADVAYGADATKEKGEKRLDLIDDVINYIYETYKDQLNYEDLVNAAFNGVFDSLDQYSEYYFASEGADELSNTLESNYAGIGVTIQLNDDGEVLITAVTKDGPAEKAGITAGGTVTKIDSVSTKGLSLDEAANKMRGKAGTQVTVTIKYSGVEKSFTLTRAELVAPSLNYELMEGSIGYIDLTSFSTASANEFRQARTELLAKGAKSLVLDLRNNTGGYLDIAIQIADVLMDKGTICILEQQGKVIETYTAKADDTKKVPIVILQNQYSASASELLIQALKDNGLAKTVGTNTYGKGVAQIVVGVNNGDSLKLSECYFLGPNKEKITTDGIKPDYYVYSSYDFDEATTEKINNVLPLDLKQRYFAGQYGLNVLAAQQRLQILGFDVDSTARMDTKTVEAIKVIQKDGGGKPYGGLDYTTLKLLNTRYESAVSMDKEDLQLKKALELLK